MNAKKIFVITLTILSVLGAVRLSYGFGRFVEAKESELYIQATIEGCRQALKEGRP